MIQQPKNNVATTGEAQHRGSFIVICIGIYIYMYTTTGKRTRRKRAGGEGHISIHRCKHIFIYNIIRIGIYVNSYIYNHRVASNLITGCWILKRSRTFCEKDFTESKPPLRLLIFASDPPQSSSL